VKVTKEKVEKSQVFLTIEMEPAEVEKGLAESYKHLVQRVNIPGFRKGKAPRAIFERYVGKGSLLEDALNHLVPDAYEKALKEQDIEAIAQPQIEITQTEPVVFKATVPVAPTVKLGDYHSIKMSPEPVAVTEEDINQSLEQLRHQHATWEPVPVAQAVNFDDLVVLDIESQISNAPYINQKGIQYYVRRGLTFPAPGFPEQVVGMKKEEAKEFKLQFPPDYPRAEMAGKEASFKVKVIEMKQEVLPELNDAFAKQVGPEFKTLAELRGRVSTNLKLRAAEKARRDFEEKVIEALVQQSPVEFPPILVEKEVHDMLEEQARRLQLQGVNFEDYLKSLNKTVEQLHQEMHPLAEKRVIRALVLGKVAEEEKVAVSDAEIDAEIENMVKGATEKKEELQKLLNTPRSRESTKQMLLTRKTIERLTEIAKGQSGEVTRESSEAKLAGKKKEEGGTK